MTTTSLSAPELGGAPSTSKFGELRGSLKYPCEFPLSIQMNPRSTFGLEVQGERAVFSSDPLILALSFRIPHLGIGELSRVWNSNLLSIANATHQYFMDCVLPPILSEMTGTSIILDFKGIGKANYKSDRNFRTLQIMETSPLGLRSEESTIGKMVQLMPNAKSKEDHAQALVVGLAGSLTINSLDLICKDLQLRLSPLSRKHSSSELSLSYERDSVGNYTRFEFGRRCESREVFYHLSPPRRQGRL